MDIPEVQCIKMGKITKERPYGFKTETEAWNEDTKKIEEIEKMSNENKVTEKNFFDLFCRLNSVSNRTSLNSSPEYIKRMVYCKKLEDKLLKKEESFI